MFELMKAGKFPKEFAREDQADLMYYIAEAVVGEVKKNIEGNRLGLPKGSPEWIMRSLDPRPLVNTTDYVKGLRPVKLGKTAAIKGNLQLALWLEHGTRKMAPRPHLAPSIRSARKLIDPVIGKKMADAIFTESEE